MTSLTETSTDAAYDLTPLGLSELLPVTLRGNGEPGAYPEAVRIASGIDAERLARDFESCRAELSPRLFGDRQPSLPGGQSLREALATLGRHGFRQEVYQPYSMRAPGQTDLLPCIPEYTREVLGRLRGRCFRQQYLLAQARWTSSLHRDHYNFRLHGLRVHIPISCASHLAFADGPGAPERTYRFEPGEAWFVNVGRWHRGFNPEACARLIIQIQLDNDLDVLTAVAR